MNEDTAALYHEIGVMHMQLVQSQATILALHENKGQLEARIKELENETEDDFESEEGEIP